MTELNDTKIVMGTKSSFFKRKKCGNPFLIDILYGIIDFFSTLLKKSFVIFNELNIIKWPISSQSLTILSYYNITYLNYFYISIITERK